MSGYGSLDFRTYWSPNLLCFFISDCLFLNTGFITKRVCAVKTEAREENASRKDCRYVFVITGKILLRSCHLFVNLNFSFFWSCQTEKKKSFILVHRVGEETKLGFELLCKHKESESCEYLDKPLVGNTALISLFWQLCRDATHMYLVCREFLSL